jgi:hypothetical protein
MDFLAHNNGEWGRNIHPFPDELFDFFEIYRPWVHLFLLKNACRDIAYGLSFKPTSKNCQRNPKRGRPPSLKISTRAPTCSLRNRMKKYAWSKNDCLVV